MGRSRRPTISGTSGSLHHGATMVLNGSGFSVHPDFHPDPDKLARVFDDFNDGTLTTNPYGTWSVFNEAAQPAVLGTSSPRTPVPGDGFYRRRSVGLGSWASTAATTRSTTSRRT